MASQLQVPDHAIGIMGHWASKDPMARRYDSSRTSTEIVYKEFVRKNFVAGWRPTLEGLVPFRPAVPVVVVDLPTVVPDVVVEPSGFDVAPSCRGDGSEFLRGAEEQVRLMACMTLPKHVVQVVNLVKGTVHLYVDGSRTVCGAWRCGRSDVVHKAVSFAAHSETHSGLSSPHCFCRQCFTHNMLLKLGAERVSSCPDSSSSSSDESSSSSSSSTS